VLGFSKQAFLKRRADPVSQRDWDNAHLTNAAIDLHRDEPGFGYRFVSDEIEAEAGLKASERSGASGGCAPSSGSGRCIRKSGV
jgi:putative transposase